MDQKRADTSFSAGDNLIRTSSPAIRRFLWSRAGRGGTDALLSSLLEAVSRGEHCYWIVPEPYSHATERLLAERGGAPVCLHAEVLTFRRLCDHILAAGGGLADPVLDAGGRLLLMRRAVREASGQLRALGILAAKPGFLPGLIQTLDECKCYGVTPVLLEKAGASASGAASGRLFDLALIFSAYEMLCAHTDPRDRVTLTWETLRRTNVSGNGIDQLRQPNPDIRSGTLPHIFVSNFASFTPQERLLLTALADRAASFTVLFCGELAESGFSPLHATSRQLSAHFPGGVSHDTVDNPEPERHPALRHMESHWFDRKSPVYAGCSATVEIWQASGESSEVRFAAERIVRLARDEGCRWRDIAVIASDYTAYAPLIESIFPQYGIPFFSDQMDELSQKPLTRCLRAAADCVRFGYRASDVMALLRSGLLPVSNEDADLMEMYLRRWNLRGSRFSGERDWERPLGGWHDTPTEAQLTELTRVNTVRRHIADALKKLSGGRTARDCAERLYHTLEALGVPEGIALREKALHEAGEGKLAVECGQMWNLFCQSLDQCVGVLNDDPMAYDEFCDICLLVLSGYTVGSIPVSLDRVHTGDQGRLPRLPKRVVIYLGADSDRVPARSGEGGLLAAEEREALGLAGCELPPDPPARIEREMYNLYTACTLPTQKLILTVPAASDGKIHPAACVERLSKMFSLQIRLVPPPGPASRTSLPSRAPLSPERVAGLYGSALKLSATRVETFCACPFSYFMRYGLRAERRPESGFTPLDVGRELHGILEQCARYALERGGFAAISRGEFLLYAETLARARQDDVLRRGGAGTPRLLAQGARLARTAAMLAGRMWDEFTHSQFVPLDFELYLESREVPLHGLPDGTPSSYSLRGVADRVDGFRRDGSLFLRVIDYKTGGKTFSLRDIYYGQGAQMPLYLFLLRSLAPERYRASRAEAAGVLYVPSRDVTVRSDSPLSPEEAAVLQSAALRHSGLLLEDPDILEAMDDRLRDKDGSLPVAFTKDGSFAKRTLVASPEQMERLQNHIGKLARNAARDIACGTVTASPLDRRDGTSHCDWCAAREACLFDEETDQTRPMRGFADKEEFFSVL